MRITIEWDKRTRLDWVRTLNRIRAMCHKRGRPQPQVTVERRGKIRRGTIEY